MAWGISKGLMEANVAVELGDDLVICPSRTSGNLQLCFAVTSRSCTRRAVFRDRSSDAGRLVRLAFGFAVTLTLAGRRVRTTPAPLKPIFFAEVWT